MNALALQDKEVEHEGMLQDATQVAVSTCTISPSIDCTPILIITCHLTMTHSP